MAIDIVQPIFTCIVIRKGKNMKFIAPLLLGLSLYPAVGFSAEAEKECKEIEMMSISYYFISSVNSDQKISEVYKKQIDKLNNFSKKHKLANFKILSQDVSINPNSYSQGTSELSISIYFESKFDYALLDKARDELNLNNFSSSRSINSICE